MAPTQPLRVASRNGPPPAIVAPILGLAALGALVVIPLVVLAAIPLLLAAFERWIESDRRFRQ